MMLMQLLCCSYNFAACYILSPKKNKLGTYLMKLIYTILGPNCKNAKQKNHCSQKKQHKKFTLRQKFINYLVNSHTDITCAYSLLLILLEMLIKCVLTRSPKRPSSSESDIMHGMSWALLRCEASSIRFSTLKLNAHGSGEETETQ